MHFEVYYVTIWMIRWTYNSHRCSGVHITLHIYFQVSSYFTCLA